jgi:hypothetical protein
MARIAGVFVLVLIASVDVVRSANAACNAIPSVELLETATAANRPVPQFPFKGALGRIDRVYFLPGRTKTMTVSPDHRCVSDPSHTGPAPQLPPLDQLVVLLSVRSSDRKNAVVRLYASATTCPKLREIAARQPRPIQTFSTCSNQGVEVALAPERVTIPVPDPHEIDAAFPTAGASPAVRIVVAPSSRAEAALVASAADEPCRQACGALVETGVLACIDEIFAAPTATFGPATYSPDPVPCNVQMPTGIQPNDFSKACENSDSTLPMCQITGGLPPLKMWQDTCGGIHVPMDWHDIRNQSGTPFVRAVRGRSGIGRSNPADNPRIWVPGREFLGSTPIADPQGTSTGVSWRKPLVDVTNDMTNDPEEFDMQGTVDQNDSIVHVFPQLRTDLVCTGTNGANACMGIEQDARNGGYRMCACLDRGDPGCTCDPPLATARYFVCGSGRRAGMPCTRDRHCNPDGRCDGKPHCQDPGAVWTGQADISGTECTVNDNCASEPTKTQCGYRLFNLGGAIETTGNGTILLDPKITGGGPHRRRGVCKDNPKTVCGNGGGNGPAACGSGDCRGYQLFAGPKIP